MNEPISITDRDRQLVDLLCLGFAAKEIADKTGLPVSTVHMRTQRLYKTNACRNATELCVRYTLQKKEALV